MRAMVPNYMRKGLFDDEMRLTEKKILEKFSKSLTFEKLPASGAHYIKGSLGYIAEVDTGYQ